MAAEKAVFNAADGPVRWVCSGRPITGRINCPSSDIARLYLATSSLAFLSQRERS